MLPLCFKIYDYICKTNYDYFLDYEYSSFLAKQPCSAWILQSQLFYHQMKIPLKLPMFMVGLIPNLLILLISSLVDLDVLRMEVFHVYPILQPNFDLYFKLSLKYF